MKGWLPIAKIVDLDIDDAISEIARNIRARGHAILRLLPGMVAATAVFGFEIGAPIATCLRKAGIELSSDPSTGQGYNGLLEEFEFPPLAARIWTVGGIIHQIAPAKICLYRGVNLLGSNIDSVLSLLDHPFVEWSSLGSMGHYGDIRSLGLFFGVN